jgi:hypothetical protein
MHQRRQEVIEASRAKSLQTAATCVGAEGCDSQANLALTSHVTVSEFLLEDIKWDLTNVAGYSASKCRVQWTATATKSTVEKDTATYIVDGVMGVQNSGRGQADLGNMVVNLQTYVGGQWITKYSAVESKLLTNGTLQGNIVGGCITDGCHNNVTEFTNSPNANLRVMDPNGADAFKSEAASALTVGAKKFKYFAFQARFELPVTFTEAVTVQVLMTFGNSSAGCEGCIGNDVPYLGGSVLHNNIKTLVYSRLHDNTPLEQVNQSVKLETGTWDTTVDAGTYRNFTTEVGLTSGIVGREFTSESTTRFTSVCPCPESYVGLRIFQNTARIYSDDDVVVIDVPAKPGSDKIIRFQFVGAAGVAVEISSPINVAGDCMGLPEPLTPIREYSAQDWAADTNGVLTSAWNSRYAPLGGLTLAASNGITLTFTNKEAVANILALSNGASGKVTASAIDPQSTSGGQDVRALLWYKLTADNMLGSETRMFNSSIPALQQPINSDIGDEETLHALDGLTYNGILALLTDFVLSSQSVTPELNVSQSRGTHVKELQDGLIFTGSITGLVPQFITALYGL